MLALLAQIELRLVLHCSFPAPIRCSLAKPTGLAGPRDPQSLAPSFCGALRSDDLDCCAVVFLNVNSFATDLDPLDPTPCSPIATTSAPGCSVSGVASALVSFVVQIASIAFWLPLEMYQMETEPQETFVDLGKGWFQYQDIRHAIEIIT